MVLLLPTLASAAAVLAVPLTADTRDAAPRFSEVYIKSLTYGGSGCPSGTVNCSVSDDRQSLTIIFSKFRAQISRGSTSARKNCVVSINMEFPNGFQYSVLTTDFKGYANLDNITTGYQQSTYSFSGQTQSAVARADFKGPRMGNYEVVTTAGIHSYVPYSSCGADNALNINSELVVSGSVGGELTEDTEDELITHEYGFAWRRC